MRALLAIAIALVLVGLIGIGCENTRADLGRDATFQVFGAQFYRESMPSDDVGPKVTSVSIAGQTRAGLVQQGFSGELERSANAVAVQLVGDIGYWIVPAGIPSSAAPSSPTFQASFAVATFASLGPREIAFRAVDGEGRFGPTAIRPLEVLGPRAPNGRLVISLSWNNQADLDLHVLLPNGIELFKRNRTEYERPPVSLGPLPPGTPADGGVLDRDSNGQCVFDGQRAENAIWTEAPPRGHYVVRVDTFSLCGAPNAIWRLEALLDGVRIGAAQGTSTDNDVRFEHVRGGGVLALELDVP
jgi:hypothetical protein